MGFDLVNQYVARLLLAIERGDSINRVSKKAGVSYGYTHQWIERLEEIGVVERDDGIRVSDDEFLRAFEGAARTVLSRSVDLEDAYLLPNFSGMDYRFSRTDAVFVWTKGGYQIGRDRNDYPIFIDVLVDDEAAWHRFFDAYSLESVVEERTAGEPGIYFVIFPQEDFETAWFENASVTPLEETVAWARTYEANFQPALEMLDEMYDLGLGVTYSERNVS